MTPLTSHREQTDAGKHPTDLPTHTSTQVCGLPASTFVDAETTLYIQPGNSRRSDTPEVYSFRIKTKIYKSSERRGDKT